MSAKRRKFRGTRLIRVCPLCESKFDREECGSFFGHLKQEHSNDPYSLAWHLAKALNRQLNKKVRP